MHTANEYNRRVIYTVFLAIGVLIGLGASVTFAYYHAAFWTAFSLITFIAFVDRLVDYIDEVWAKT